MPAGPIGRRQRDATHALARHFHRSQGKARVPEPRAFHEDQRPFASCSQAQMSVHDRGTGIGAQ